MIMRILLIVIIILLVFFLYRERIIQISSPIITTPSTAQTVIPTISPSIITVTPTTVPTIPINTPTTVPTIPSNTPTTVPTIQLIPSSQVNIYTPGKYYNFLYNCSPKTCPPVLSTDFCPVQTVSIYTSAFDISYPRNILIKSVYLDIISMDTKCLPNQYFLKGQYEFINASDVQYKRGDGIKSKGDLIFTKVTQFPSEGFTRYQSDINVNVLNLTPGSRYWFKISINSETKLSFTTKNINVDYTLQDIPAPTQTTQSSYPVKIIDGITNIDSLKTFQINNLVKIDKNKVYRFNFNVDGSCTAACSCPSQMINVQVDDLVYPGGQKTLKILPFADVRDRITCITDKTYTPLLFMSWSFSFYYKNGDLAFRAGLGAGSPTLENFDANSRYNTESIYPVTPNYDRYANFPTRVNLNLPADNYTVILTMFSQEKNNSAIVTNFNIIFSY